MTFSVAQGILDPGTGSMVEIDSSRWFAWLEEHNSFRYESNHHAPFTVRKEKSDYWYGYRKVTGKLHKRYIGRSIEVTQVKLESVAEALNLPPEPRIPKVTQLVTEKVTQLVTDKVTVTDDRVGALEARLQLVEERLGKLRA